MDAKGAKHTVLSLVDSGTKFGVAGRVGAARTPGSKICAEFINGSWLSWAGNPRYLQCDQGVHNKGRVASLLRSQGIEIKQAGAKRSGRTERHGGILKSMLRRMISTHQLAGEFAISAALTQCTSVKNGSYNHDGYVPSQWVLGRIPPDVTSLLQEPDRELLGVHQSIAEAEDEFGKTMLIRQWAKEAFTYLDGSQRLRRAMLRQSRPLRIPYQTGDLVSYHRRGKWYGPGRVLSQEGKSSLWLVHGGMTVLARSSSTT